MGFKHDRKQAQEPAETNAVNDVALTKKEERQRQKQLRAEEKARAKELKRREREITATEKRLAKEKAVIDAKAARQKKKAEKHRLKEEEEALKILKSLAVDAEYFDPQSVGMSPELYKRAMDLQKKRDQEAKEKRLEDYKKKKSRRNDAHYEKSAKEKASKAKFLTFLNLPYKLAVECETEYKTTKLVLHILLAFLTITLGSHFIFSIQFSYILIYCVIYFLAAPSIIYYSYRKKYEAERFRACSRYIEQMIFSFTRRHKLLTALEETRLVLDGKIGEAIDYAIDVIRNRVGEDDIYSVALRKIEACLPSSRVQNLHEFLIAVERDGGHHDTTMKILLEDVREWDIRTNQFKQNQAVKGISLLVSILMSVAVCWFMTNILPDEMGGNISGSIVYQLITSFMLIVMFFIYLFGNRKLTRSWIVDNTSSNESRIKADRETIAAYYRNPKGKIKPFLAIIRMQTEIEKVFPRWVLRFALLCSSHPVPVALAVSVSTAPDAIKADLEKLVDSINQNPTSIEPYLEFCRYYDLPQVHSMMMMIYSLSEYGLHDADQQILSLVTRNNALQANAEKIQNDEQLSRFSLYPIIPMLIGSMVMMVDVVLMILNMVEKIL